MHTGRRRHESLRRLFLIAHVEAKELVATGGVASPAILWKGAALRIAASGERLEKPPCAGPAGAKVL